MLACPTRCQAIPLHVTSIDASVCPLRIPGSAVLVRYVKVSHQNDPWRTLLELALFAFAVRTVLSSRTRTDRSAKNFVQLTEKVRQAFCCNDDERPRQN